MSMSYAVDAIGARTLVPLAMFSEPMAFRKIVGPEMILVVGVATLVIAKGELA